jgi:uncharacterized protein (TIGR02646 family)
MRHLPANSEPLYLKEFREVNPAATWDDFKNDAQESYKQLVEHIVSHQNGLCAYCEINLTETDRMIEHFHPKSDTASEHNWGLDFQNMLATCKGGTNPYSKDEDRFLEPLKDNITCDQRKGGKNLDRIVLHPRDIPVSPSVFKVGMNGEIQPNSKHCEQAGVAVSKIMAAIEEPNFNLNCNRLKDARRKVWELLLEYERSGETVDDLIKDFLLPDYSGRLFRFFTTIRSYFAPESEHFINAHLAEFDSF